MYFAIFAITLAAASFTDKSNYSKQIASDSNASQFTIDFARAEECFAIYLITKHAAFL
jgi:hypothetical protein